MQPLPEPNLQGATHPGGMMPAGYEPESQVVPAANPGGFPSYQYIPPTNRQ